MANPLQPATQSFKNYAYVQSKIFKTEYMYVVGHCTFYTTIFGPQLVLVIWQQDNVWVVDEMGWEILKRIFSKSPTYFVLESTIVWCGVCVYTIHASAWKYQ